MKQSSQRNSNLPAALSTFIGRQRETAAVQSMLSDRRLVTLTGPGGSGKTRLALHVAGLSQPPFADGIWLVELASLKEAELLPQTVAGVLGLRERSGQSLTSQIIDYLEFRASLLVLDNCEHLVESVAQLVVTLLSACPELTVLATSREPVGVAGEAILPVPPLSLPAPQPWERPVPDEQKLAAFSESEAVQLFSDRATAVQPNFALSTHNAPAVAAICRRLDGMPLAIELAAARLTTLSEQQIAERLNDRFSLLTSHLKMVVPRHKTLEATIDWSHDLLSEPEQMLFRRLSVFRGGWTLAAAERVCGYDEVAIEDVLELLTSLVAKSMVVADQAADSQRRFHYLETIHDYAARKLGAAGEETVLRERHLDYFLDWAETNGPRIDSAEQVTWVARFGNEHANLLGALDWAARQDASANRALQLAAACGTYWRTSCFQTGGRSHLEAVLQLPPNQEPTLTRARALFWAGALAYQQSDFNAARPPLEEALAIGRDLGPEGQLITARALDWLGEVATETGDYDAALPMFEESLSISRAIGYERGIANMLMQLGWAAMRVGDYDQATPLINESVDRMRVLGEPRRLAMALGGLGELATRHDDLAAAERYLQDSLDKYSAIGDQWGAAATLGSLGWVALKQRQFQRMRHYLSQSIELRREIGEVGGLAWCLEKLGEATVVQANDIPAAARRPMQQRAVYILATAAALRSKHRALSDPADLPRYEELLRQLRQAMGDSAFEAAWSKGQAMEPSAAVELALNPVEPGTDEAALTAGQAARMKHGGLSPRERETAVLIAQGKTNREIAAALTVREKTVETYVTRILNKLGFDSRVQVATWAMRAGLLEPKPDED